LNKVSASNFSLREQRVASLCFHKLKSTARTEHGPRS